MNEQANTRRARAEAARINRKLARAQSMRRVGLSSFALFALVFTLLTFRLTTGQDPSTGNTVATTNTPSVAAPSIVSSNEDNESEASGESDDGAYSSSPVTPSQAPTPAPTTAAS